jgi:hypothetical protein
MSSTRHAAEGTPFRQERYASSEAYRTSLNGLQVAKRCALLGTDPELAALIWFIQDRSLSDPFCVGGRLGSVEAIAAELLWEANWSPPTSSCYVEDFSEGRHGFELVSTPIADALARTRVTSELADALRKLALDPSSVPAELPGIGAKWRSVLEQYRDTCRKEIMKPLAPTSVTQRTVAALHFARETRKLVLVTGRSRLGKSVTSKAVCAASSGGVRYVLTPENSDMESLYRAMAKSLGVADARSYKSVDVREHIERMLMASRLMLVFDEAHNLFSRLRRVTQLPQRVLWLRRLIDSGIPMAFVALPEFETRMERCVTQLDWDAHQITELICHMEELDEKLTTDDFDTLVARIGSDLSDKAKTLIAGRASLQHGAQCVVDIIDVARHTAAKAGRRSPSDDDVREAIGDRPQFFTGKPSPKRPKEEPKPDQPDLGLSLGARRMHGVRTLPADPLHRA